MYDHAIPHDWHGQYPLTDLSRWKLLDLPDELGDHNWVYTCEGSKQRTLEKFWIGAPYKAATLPKATDALEAAKNGYTFYKNLQAPDGHWPGEYSGPHFLTPGYVIGSYVTKAPIKEEERLEMIRYLFLTANPEDGGWGIHVEGKSTVFGTGLNYVTLRLLGVDAEHPVMIKARGTLHKLGGACRIPAWGKFWLSVLNVYDWEGVNPVPPELWLLPEWLPIHPYRWWIHTRNVYIPMSYLYGVRYRATENGLIRALRQELYPEPYYSIDWPAQRNNVAEGDIYAPHTYTLNGLFAILGAYEGCALPPLRRAGLDYVYKLVVMEDENSDYQDLGPVNKMMNMVVRHHADGPESHAFKEHVRRRQDFLWLGPKGMMMCGTNGSQLWDITFICQALVKTGLGELKENKKSMMAALGWLDKAQMQSNPVHFESAYRQATKGAWPFSTKTQGYTVSDCAAEGMKAVLFLQENIPVEKRPISEKRLCDTVDILLGMQNSSGGWSSYEPRRGPLLLEYINPSEVFGDIMIDVDYPECTTSAITGLAIFRKNYPHYRTKDIEAAMGRAIKYIHAAQDPCGGWFGRWGICFTYATMFALESLSLVGETYSNSKAAKKACDFIVSKQREDGGWGESWETCEKLVWIEHEESQVVQTAWSGLALMYAQYPHREPLEKAVKLIMSRQLPDGSWAQEAIEGVFNKTVAIAYPNFKFSFTIWMLGRAHRYLQTLAR
ncbi:Lanosterol synthase (Oxidosqualene--lanosterol cyclase) [Serendipita sp. 396]|nr:Lanosterol synthase (Oxidosqualene--lanosterol cyclase) [Serendipita sp. 396]KAG8789634.1 Lanosterol synthase (Oxidosqualene--lanosterol cyclase) [Serendipita sp. 397]KAG8804428.1 Lanosterol synthase (Oxidosqualene--lanosterol cyclase) [Serendipita sp. 398]KAG8878108.1 Lanosterol synthase (Oxidosqualene--lanosterol cyclase) [Serendipita sp. 405]